MKRIALLALFLCTAASAQERPGWLGLGFTRESDGQHQWLQVRIVIPGGPADRAGIALQDVITSIDGKALAFKDDLDMLEFFGHTRPKRNVCVDVIRKQARTTICITPIEMTDEYYERWKLNLEIAAQKRHA